MSLADLHRIKALEIEVQRLKQTPPSGAFPFERLEKLEEGLKDMQNKYRMLNARISRK